jgi:hypothetical protein
MAWKLRKWVKDKIKGMDSFPQSVQISFNGDTQFTTILGGLVSIIIKIVTFLYFILLISNIFKRGNSSKSFNKIVKDITYDSTKHYIGKGTFAFAFKLIGPTPDILFDPTYFEVEVNLASYKSFNSVISSTSAPIEIEK